MARGELRRCRVPLVSGDGDPFAEVAKAVAAGGGSGGGGAGTGGAGGKRRGGGDWMAPVPADAPEPRASHNAKGRPSKAWPYRNAAGEVLHWVCRFESPGGGKDVLPQTLWRDGGRYEWRWKAAPVPRPLFGLDELAAAPAAPVLIVEGEKTADAAARLFPDFAVMTWSGGSKATGNADWSPLAGRRVVIVPDADLAGREAADKVKSAAMMAGAEGVAVAAIPADLPEGWDCADAFPDSFPQAALRELVAAALETASAGAMECPHGFTLDGEGLWFRDPAKDGEGRGVSLSDGFDVLGEARDPQGDGWGVVIAFRDRDRRHKRVIVHRAALATDGGAVRGELAGAGLFVRPGRGYAERFAHFLAAVKHTRRLTLAQSTGWVDPSRFVLPGGAIGPADAEPVLFDGPADAMHYGAKGTLDGWQREIAARAPGNRLLAFALSLAFVGPLMEWLDLEGGGFHFRGASSTGKTSLALAAGSVWGGGGPLGFAQSWRATGNALEGVAFGHSETLLILDELSLVDPQEAGSAAYALATGQGKGRARQDGQLRRRAEWRVMLLSTGEIALADHMRAAKRAERTMAGQELRLLDISADMGAGMGAWEALHDAASPAAFSDAIKAACARHYGHAGRAFVAGLVADRDRWRAEARRLLAAFVQRAKRDGDSGQVHRAALRFGAVAVAGELAIALGVLPWPAGTAEAAAMAILDRWADGFGRKGMREERQVVETVRNAIQQNLSRFGKVARERLDDDEPPGASNREGEARALATLGFVHDVDFQTCYLFHDAGWTEILKGFDPKYAAAVLLAKGYLVPGDGKHLKRKQRIGGQAQRFFTVRASILEYDASDEAETPSPPAGLDAGRVPSRMQPGGGWDDLPADDDDSDPFGR